MLRAGKAVGRLMRNSYPRGSMGRGLGRTVIGGSVVAGAAAGVLDREGPYPAIAEDVFGDSRTFNAAAKAAITNSFSASRNNYGTSDYYYGRSADPSRQRVSPTGDMVFGMYNLRR